jgi:hypothetical protein
MIAILTLKPSQNVLDSAKHGLSKTHVFIDLSPSTRHKALQEPAKLTLHKLYKELSRDDQLSFGISSSRQIYRPSSFEELAEFLNSLETHRAGLKIGNAVTKQLEKVGDINRLILVSDNDRYSWSDFNWRYLNDRVMISRIPISDGNSGNANVFISQVDAKGLIDKYTLSWTVDIWGVGIDKPVEGIAKLVAGNKVVITKQWNLSSKNNKLSIPFEVRRDDLNKFLNSQTNRDEYLTWKIEVSDKSYNNLVLDDEFRSPFRQVNQDVLISAQPSGEMFLEDGMHHLRVILEILGFRVRRIDQLDLMKSNYWDYPFLILSDGGSSTSSFCPVMPRGSKSKALTNVWLIPNPQATNFKGLCQCYARLSGSFSNPDLTKVPEYCEDVETRDQYVGVLRSLGAKQIGGSVDDVLGSMAWEWENTRDKVRILAFTIPLKPTRNMGVSYGELPSVVSSLTDWVGLSGSDAFRAGENWPQIADITDFLDKQGISRINVVTTNVPTSESLMQVLDEKNLPGIFEIENSMKIINRVGVGKNIDPMPWLTLIAIVLSVIAVLEGIYLFVIFFLKKKRGLGHLALWFVVFNLSLTDLAQASPELNLFGYDTQSMSLTRLRNEVNGRTSIELSQEILSSNDLEKQMRDQGWLWVSGPEKILDADGQIPKSLENWIKRGGFLVIERFTNPNMISLPSLGKDNEKNWKPIPPDHEIMRSFHLLESLPKCNDNVWHGYHFDSRIAIIGIPYSLVDTLTKSNLKRECQGELNFEDQVRIFINVLMVALTTDYKKDQIHLPEILKRLR